MLHAKHKKILLVGFICYLMLYSQKIFAPELSSTDSGNVLHPSEYPLQQGVTIYQILPRLFRAAAEEKNLTIMQYLSSHLQTLRSLGFDMVLITGTLYKQTPRHDGIHYHLNTSFSVENDHGYWPISLTDFDPTLGTWNDIDALIAEANELKMGIIIDAGWHHLGPLTEQDTVVLKARGEERTIRLTDERYFYQGKDAADLALDFLSNTDHLYKEVGLRLARVVLMTALYYGVKEPIDQITLKAYKALVEKEKNTALKDRSLKELSEKYSILQEVVDPIASEDLLSQVIEVLHLVKNNFFPNPTIEQWIYDLLADTADPVKREIGNRLLSLLSLEGIPTLKLTNDFIFNAIIEAYEHWIDRGVTTFRIDAAKHMRPEILSEIIRKLSTYAQSKGRELDFINELLFGNNGVIHDIQQRITDGLDGTHTGSYFLDMELAFRTRDVVSGRSDTGDPAFQKAISSKRKDPVRDGINQDANDYSSFKNSDGTINATQVLLLYMLNGFDPAYALIVYNGSLNRTIPYKLRKIGTTELKGTREQISFEDMADSHTARALSEYLAYRKRFITYSDRPVRILFGEKSILIMQKGDDGHIVVLNFGNSSIDFTQEFRNIFPEGTYELLFRTQGATHDFSIFEQPSNKAYNFHDPHKRYSIPPYSASLLVKQGTQAHDLIHSLLKISHPVPQKKDEVLTTCGGLFGKLPG